jgi:hypothetical protein
MLRKALAGGVESGESFASEDTVKPTPEQAMQRFEHYELVTGEDGKTVELGRGAMGVTYKAFDLDLRCPVALKVISEKYLGDDGNRLQRPYLGLCGRATRSLTSNSSSAVSHRNKCSKNLARLDSTSIGPRRICSRAVRKAGPVPQNVTATNTINICCLTSHQSTY